MQYSLLSQFQGAIAGAIVGEWIGRLAQHQDFFRGQRTHSIDSLGSCPLFPVLLAGTHSLSQQGRLNLADWQLQLHNYRQMGQFGSSHSNSDLNSDPYNFQTSRIAAIPIGLFFHEDASKLYRQLNCFWAAYPSESSTQAEMFLLGLILARLLKQPPALVNLLPELILTLNESEWNLKSLMQPLQTLQTLLQETVSLDDAATQLNQFADELPVLSTALYSFLSTPTDYRLCLLRTAQLTARCSESAACSTIVGTLVGTYNGSMAIPLDWRSLIGHRELQISSNLAESSLTVHSNPPSISLEQQVLQLSRDLLAAWSGHYSFTPPIPVAESLSVAAPGIIRPR